MNIDCFICRWIVKINYYQCQCQCQCMLLIAINRAVCATVIIKHNYMLMCDHKIVINIMLCLLNSTGHISYARGTRDSWCRMAEPIPPSDQSSSYSLSTLSSHVSTDQRAVTDMNGKTRTLRCAPFLCRLRRRECCMLGAPSSHPTVPFHELPPARLVIHRQTSAHERRKWTRSVNRGRAYWRIYASGNIGCG